MEDEYNIDPQDSTLSEINRSEVNEITDSAKEFGEAGGYDESYEDEEGGNSFRGRGGRGNFRGRGRGPPPGWMNGPPPMRFRGRGYGPGGPPMRGRGFFRGRGGPRYGPNNGPNYDNNWGPMGPPPPGMMGGPPPFGPPPGMMPPGGPMGPPPNMMGQPPPFGPPGMPPPNMPAPELWVETKSDEGKSYYYHARTRETTWTRPQESPTCKVITQAEVDVMTAAGQYPGMGQSMPMNGPMGGPPMGGPPMGMMPNGMMGMMPPGVGPHGPTPGSVPPFMNQPPPWVKDNNQMQSKMDSQDSSPEDDAPPGEAPTQPTQPPGTGPGSGAGWGWGWAPPMVAQPPGLAAAAVPDAGAATQPQTGAPVAVSEVLPTDSASTPKKEETVIPPELCARAGEWTTHRAPDGRPYYYHAASRQSVWEKPQPLKEFDDLQNKISKEKGEKVDNKKDKRIIDDGKIEVIDVEAHAEAVAAAEAAERERAERERAERERAEKERAEKERVEKEKLEKEKAKTDKSRPVSSTPISGTPWCVVWTGDGRVFFYNPTARLSVWERPAQLAGRADVDQAVAHPPHQRDQQRKETPSVAATPTKNANGELKRGASDTSDSDSEPAKKAKQEEAAKKKPAPPPGVIDMGKEAAMEAEARAARERALVPFEQRVRAFLQMLHESDVSAFSPWEKELHKIVFDSRYLLLDSRERKQVFDKYVRERAEEERKEKKNRIQQKKLAFRAVMEEAKLHSKSSFTEFSGKFSRDERFKSIEKMRDRETYFNEYIAEVRKKEKEEKDRKRELAKTEFIALLKEKSVDRHSRWLEVKKKIDSDARYKAVESSTMREDYFREYCKMVKEERKKEKDGKEKERERGSKKDKKDKDRDKEKEREKETKKDKKKEKTGDVSETEAAPCEEALARAARAQASIKERERQVQRALATSLRDRDKEREYHKRDEAVQHFNALLADLVRNPDLTWREAKKQLKKDHRYSLAEELGKDDKERLFGQHIGVVSSKRRDKLRALLTELGVGGAEPWRDVKERLRDHPGAPQYKNASQMEREFRDYQRDKQSNAKTALRQLLLETRAITHRSLAAVKEAPHALVALHDTLKHDARYIALDHIPEEREAIIMSYLEELDKKGPPPPPTATEPSRRPKQ